MRPLYGMVAANSQAAVEEHSRKALELMSAGAAVEECSEALCKLRGVGVATASAVFAAYSAEYPFMSDEAMEAVLHAPAHGKQYSIEAYGELCTKLRAKAAELGDGFTARDVELALYSISHAKGCADTNLKTLKQSRQKSSADSTPKSKRTKTK